MEGRRRQRRRRRSSTSSSSRSSGRRICIALVLVVSGGGSCSGSLAAVEAAAAVGGGEGVAVAADKNNSSSNIACHVFSFCLYYLISSVISTSCPATRTSARCMSTSSATIAPADAAAQAFGYPQSRRTTRLTSPLTTATSKMCYPCVASSPYCECFLSEASTFAFAA